VRYARSKGEASTHLSHVLVYHLPKSCLGFNSGCFQVVTTAEGQALAKEYNIHFFETSAKQDIDVDTAFVTIATDVKDRMIVDGASVGPAASGHKIVPGKPAEQKKGCC
jgi:hypothetical protein